MINVIFFGNGLLSDITLNLLKQSDFINIAFHAKTKADLSKVKQLKITNQDSFGILASFGHLITDDLLTLFEPTGILNIHPSLLPKYRGPSPIETAILNGDQDFSVSIMKLVKTMDAGPVYYQNTLHPSDFTTPLPEKTEIYSRLATIGTLWILNHLPSLPSPIPQDHHLATFTSKLNKTMSLLNPEEKTAPELLNQIRAFQGYPKSKITLNQIDCIIHQAHIDTGSIEDKNAKIKILCNDQRFLIIDKIQPSGKKPMDSQSFYNGYIH